mgnify:FL=1
MMYNLQDRGSSESPKEQQSSAVVGMTQSDMMVSHGTGSAGGGSTAAWMNLPPSAAMTQR